MSALGYLRERMRPAAIGRHRNTVRNERDMAQISVVVPVYKVQPYLRECLDSILEQPFNDIEVIAVDDATPDECGRIIDEYAERDPRVHAIHLSSNVGLGRARNAG